jgi:TolB-like protein
MYWTAWTRADSTCGPVFLPSSATSGTRVRLSRRGSDGVETTLAGDPEILQEYVIGTEVYERKPPYHPSVDSIVRSEARRLRNKLKEYYESVGRDDAVLICYRLGSYVPIFRPNRRHDGNDNLKDDGQSELLIEGGGIRTVVFPFVDASDGDLSGVCAQIITDELIHEIGRTEGFRVSAASAMAPLVAQARDFPSVARKLDAQIVFEGTVREDNHQLHITSRVVNADGFLIWSERFETEPDIQSLFKVSERIASALISRVPTEKSSIRKRNVKNVSIRSTVLRGTNFVAPTFAPTAQRKSRKDRDGFGKRFTSQYSTGGSHHTAATTLNSPTDKN